MTGILFFRSYIPLFLAIMSNKSISCPVTKELPHHRLALDFHTAKVSLSPNTSVSCREGQKILQNVLTSSSSPNHSPLHITHLQLLDPIQLSISGVLVSSLLQQTNFRRRRISERSCAHKPQNYTPPSSISILGPKHSLRSSFSRKTNRKYGFR